MSPSVILDLYSHGRRCPAQTGKALTTRTHLTSVLLRHFLIASCLLGFVEVRGQAAFPITLGNINTCVGAFLDSGGQGGTGYGNNENFTAVICTDTPGDAISLTWVTFNLSTAGPNPVDRIRIWDGNNTGEPFLGEYTGTELQGLVTSATSFNTSGCLTVQFISNSTGTGIFAAVITCYTPCERPTAEAFMDQPAPAMVCMGETITFDGSASYAATGFNISEYLWDFADGNTDNSGPVVQHAFSAPGEYIVQLYIYDDNGCVSTNPVDLQVLVSTVPNFTGSLTTTETCLGAELVFNGEVTPVTWTGSPSTSFDDLVPLPDDVGIPVDIPIGITQFPPGATLTDISDLLSVCVNMEHSFMGDLVIYLTCPNGQSVIFHQQNGGGTDLGIPVWGDTPPVLGTCWEYCWSPFATNGTWVANSGGTTLPAGTYESLNPMSQLEGCPLNGTWTLTFLDLWGGDNGNSCNWWMEFNPAIIPDATEFTPEFNENSMDSVVWTGPNIVQDPNNPLDATASTTGSGTFNYNLSVTDNFGCTYDTTFTVTVNPAIDITAGPDVVLCNDSLPLAGEILGNAPPSDCNYTLTLIDSFGDGWNGGANVAVVVNGVSTVYTLATGTAITYNIPVLTGATVQLIFTAGNIWNNENSYIFYNDMGQVVYQSPQGPPTGVAWTGVASCGGGVAPVAYEWTPSTGLSATDVLDPMVYFTTPTWYYLSVYPIGSPECASVDSVLVSPDPGVDAGLDSSLVICASDAPFQLIDMLGGTPDAGGTWTDADGNVVPQLFQPLTGEPGIYTYTAISVLGCIATSTVELEILPLGDPNCCGLPDAGPDDFTCELSIGLNAVPGGTVAGIWSGAPGVVFADPLDPITTVSVPGSGTYWFVWTEDDGQTCFQQDSLQVVLTEPLAITFNTTDAICFLACDGTAGATITGGNITDDYTFDWSSGTSGLGIDAVDGLCTGEYSLTVSDDNGCDATATFFIDQPVLLEIDSMATLPVTCSGDCDGTILVFDPEAVSWSYNGGGSWTDSPVRENSCEGLYEIVIRNAAGCLGTGQVVVTGPPPVIADFAHGPIPANVNDPRIFFYNTSSGAETYVWDIAGMHTTTETDPVFVFPNTEPGVYTVCLAAFNSNMCVDTVCHFVTIDDVLFTYVPNTFTPDGDGLNDLFFMSTNIPVITKFEMWVFDRWGQVVFNTKDPYEPWNGGYQNGGDPLKSEVYAYRIIYEVQGSLTSRELVGHVTLLK